MTLLRVAALFSILIPAVVNGADTVAEWVNGPGDNSYGTTGKMSTKSEVRIRVVECPTGNGNGLVIWKTDIRNANNVGMREIKRWDGITRGQILKHTLTEDKFISVSTIPVSFAKCSGLESKDGAHTMVLKRGASTWKFEIKVINEF